MDKKLHTQKCMRTSKNREEIISLLMNEKVPVSVDYIYSRLKERNSSISLSTVYRIMDKLCLMNEAVKSAEDGGKALYEPAGSGHRHYIICTKCKKILPLKECPVSGLEKEIKDSGFHITGHKYELYGECSSCYNKNSSHI